jgi:hypothetical protein
VSGSALIVRVEIPTLSAFRMVSRAVTVGIELRKARKSQADRQALLRRLNGKRGGSIDRVNIPQDHEQISRERGLTNQYETMVRSLKGDINLAHQHWWPIPIGSPNYQEEIQEMRKEVEELQDDIHEPQVSNPDMVVDINALNSTDLSNTKQHPLTKIRAKDCNDSIESAIYAREHIRSVLAIVRNRNDGLLSEVSDYLDEKFGIEEASPGEDGEESDALKIERLRRRFVTLERRMSKQIIDLRNLRAAEAESDFDAQIQLLYSRLQKVGVSSDMIYLLNKPFSIIAP